MPKLRMEMDEKERAGAIGFAESRPASLSSLCDSYGIKAGERMRMSRRMRSTFLLRRYFLWDATILTAGNACCQKSLGLRCQDEVLCLIRRGNIHGGGGQLGYITIRRCLDDVLPSN